MAAAREDKLTEVKIVEMPYIHPKIQLSDLKENQKLYDENAIKRIRDLTLPEGRIKRAQLQAQGIRPAPWDVIKSGDNYYAIYKGKEEIGHLGSGAFGFTKLAQNLTTGEILVLKVMQDPHKELEADFAVEKKGLASAEQLVFAHQRAVPRKRKNQYEILMKLAPGTDLFEFVHVSQREMPTVRWLDLGISTVEAIDKLHQNNMGHGDLHIKNFMFHPASRTAVPIDFGKAFFLQPTEKQKYIADYEYGRNNPYYMAPECARGMFSKKTDVFGAGIMLAEMLNLGYWPGGSSKDFITLSSEDTDTLPIKVEPLAVRKQLIDYVTTMLDKNPDRRPSMEEVGVFLKTIRKQYMHTPGLMTRVGYLNLEDYIQANPDEKRAMVLALQNKDEVFWLIWIK